MCRVLGVSASGFYAWRKRAPSRRRQDNAALTKTVRTIHAVSRGTYGAPRVHAELASEGIPASRNRVARVMREANIVGVSRRRFVVTTVRDGGRQAPDLVDRTFTADAPNTLWVADITYIPTWMGFLYLAVVLDVFSRRIVGWSMSATLHVTVVLDALDMALTMRRPRGVIHHSDQGSQGGFKQSSQHFDGEGFDGQEEATVGSMWTAAIAVTRSATGGDAERAAAVLDAHCGWDEQRGGCV
jgi:putative transposase